MRNNNLTKIVKNYLKYLKYKKKIPLKLGVVRYVDQKKIQ